MGKEMTIGSMLATIGKNLLKRSPLGGVIYDIADALIDDDIPQDITGDGMSEMLSKLPPETYLRVMSKTLDQEVQLRQVWADVQMNSNENPSRAREVGIMIMTVVVAILTIIYATVLGLNYLNTGVMPSIEMVAASFVVPSILIAGFFGVSTDKIVDFIIGLAVKRLMK